MRHLNNSRGVSLIAAVFIIVILAFLGVVFISLINTGSFSAIRDLQSVQSLFVAEGGAERARLQLATGATCTGLTNTNIMLGPGTFTTSGTPYNPATPVTVAAPGIDAAVTTIPVSVDPLTRNYAPQGIITIDSEMIWYGGTSGSSFTSVKRGSGGTTPAAHSSGTAVTQNQCRINAAGSVGAANRSVTVDVALSLSSSSPTPTVQPNEPNPRNYTTCQFNLAAGDNLVIAIVSLQNPFGTVADIAAGDMQLRNDTTILDSNKSLIRVTGPLSAPGTNYDVPNIFPQKTHFFLYRQTGAPASPNYSIWMRTTASNYIFGKVQMVALNGVPNSYAAIDGNVLLTTAGNGAVLSTHATGLPAGDNLILAAVQLDQITTNNRSVAAGNLRLRKGTGTGVVLNSNAFAIDLESVNNANRGNGYLLIARDTTGAANQTYTVTGSASSANSINGAVSMIVLHGIPFANLSTGVVNIPATVLTRSLTTTFPANNANIVISATQMYNTQYWNRNILTDQLVFGGGGLTPATNLLPIYMQGPIQDDNYATGLILLHNNPPANPTYNWQSQGDTANALQADTDMAAMHLTIPLTSVCTGSGSVQSVGWQ